MHSQLIKLFHYTSISAIALLIDIVTYRELILSNRVSIPVAATISYMVGLVFGYIMFTKSIFKDTKYTRRKIVEFLLYGLSGIIGALITYAVSFVVTNFLTENSIHSKALSILVSFSTVYLFRMRYVFVQA